LPGLTRQSIPFEKLFSMMDARVIWREDALRAFARA
jgi:hypothetical protein